MIPFSKVWLPQLRSWSGPGSIRSHCEGMRSPQLSSRSLGKEYSSLLLLCRLARFRSALYVPISTCCIHSSVAPHASGSMAQQLTTFNAFSSGRGLLISFTANSSFYGILTIFNRVAYEKIQHKEWYSHKSMQTKGAFIHVYLYYKYNMYQSIML